MDTRFIDDGYDNRTACTLQSRYRFFHKLLFIFSPNKIFPGNGALLLEAQNNRLNLGPNSRHLIELLSTTNLSFSDKNRIIIIRYYTYIVLDTRVTATEINQEWRQLIRLGCLLFHAQSHRPSTVCHSKRKRILVVSMRDRYLLTFWDDQTTDYLFVFVYEKFLFFLNLFKLMTY